MKYLPDKGIYFIHIPKCAGMSVHRALDLDEADYTKFAADLGVTEAEAARHALSQRFPTQAGQWPSGFVSKTLGHIHPVHLPLSYLKSEMPQSWAALNSCPHSFALTRAPRGRFLSALMQRMKEFGDAGAIRADDPAVREEAARVCDWLDTRDRFADIDYAHFTRQIDYVELEGTQVIKAVFPMTRTDVLGDWLARETGLVVDIPRSHTRRQPKRWARMIQPVARTASRVLLPRAVKKVLHPLWMKSGLFSDASASYGQVGLGADVETFIETYYARDTTLHAQSLAHAAAHDATQPTGDVPSPAS